VIGILHAYVQLLTDSKLVSHIAWRFLFRFCREEARNDGPICNPFDGKATVFSLSSSALMRFFV